VHIREGILFFERLALPIDQNAIRAMTRGVELNWPQQSKREKRRNRTRWGDLENQRKNDPQIHNTLALLKRERGKTEAICEFLWKEPKEQ